jgi:LPS export ABC transporter protein LptC
MRLQRIAFHRAVRILSGVLPLLIVGFVGVAVWNYWARTRDNPAPTTAQRQRPLSPDVAAQTGPFNFTRNENGKDKFNIAGAELTSFQDNRNHLISDVTVTVFSDQEGEPDRHIHGDTCKYAKDPEKDGEEVRCAGNVTVELDELTTAYTDQLLFDSKTGLISSPVATRIERPGHMKGTAGDMQFFNNVGLLKLTKGTHIELTDGGILNGGIAVFQQREDWVTISQGLEISSPNGWIRGGSGKADLAPGTYRPTKVTVDNGASMESTSARSVLTMRSEWLQSDLSPVGKPEHVIARGKVHTENRRIPNTQVKVADADGPASSFEGSLDSPEMEAWLTDMGRFSKIDARERPVLEGEQGTLRAEKAIHIDSDGSVVTEGASKLTGDIAIDGRDFTLANANNVRTFRTASRATLTSTSDGITTTADKTTAHIDAVTKKLTSLEQTGTVTVAEKSGRSGRAGKLTFDGNNMLFEREAAKENPQVVSEQGILKAQRITLAQQDKSFIGEGQVVMTDTSAKPATIVAARALGNDQQVDYYGNVKVYPADNGQINAEHVRAFPKDKRLDADGSRVSTSGTGFKASASSLEIVDMGNGTQTAHYIGNVEATQTDEKTGNDLVLHAQDLEVHLKSGQPDTLVATEKVTMNQKPNRRGKADRLEYNGVTGDVLLKGSETSQAELHDDESDISACSLLIRKDGSKEFTKCGNGSIQLNTRRKN